MVMAMTENQKDGPRRVILGCYPTPLQEMTNFSRALGGGRKLYLKRDDLIGVGLGGNKVRKMEYLLAEALDRSCDCVVTGGGSRSNQPLAVAACAAKVGLETHLVYTSDQRTISRSLAGLMNVREHFAGAEKPDMMRDLRKIAAELKAQGRNPYIIPPGASSPLAALGYVDAMKELFAQASAAGVHLGHVVCCGATGNTYAGIVLGARLCSPETETAAIAIGRRFSHAATLCRQAQAAAELGGYRAALSESDFHVHFSCGRGASFPTVKGREAMNLLASTEGILLDPYYTGKAFAGLLELNREGAFAKGENIAFIHTGGLSALLNSL